MKNGDKVKIDFGGYVPAGESSHDNKYYGFDPNIKELTIENQKEYITNISELEACNDKSLVKAINDKLDDESDFYSYSYCNTIILGKSVAYNKKLEKEALTSGRKEYVIYRCSSVRKSDDEEEKVYLLAVLSDVLKKGNIIDEKELGVEIYDEYESEKELIEAIETMEFDNCEDEAKDYTITHSR